VVALDPHLKNPELHLLRCIQHSFSPPWPFGGHLTGFVKLCCLPPPHRPSPLPHTLRLFHRLASSLTRLLAWNEVWRHLLGLGLPLL
jgi:hypothetical protein